MYIDPLHLKQRFNYAMFCKLINGQNECPPILCKCLISKNVFLINLGIPELVLLLGIFRRVPPLCPFTSQGNLWYQLRQGATWSVLNVLKLKGKHFIVQKRSEIRSVFQVFPCTTQIVLFGQNCSLPFSLRSLDIPVLLKSWQKHYSSWINGIVYFKQSVQNDRIMTGTWGRQSSMNKYESLSMAASSVISGTNTTSLQRRIRCNLGNQHEHDIFQSTGTNSVAGVTCHLSLGECNCLSFETKVQLGHVLQTDKMSVHLFCVNV
jgi:hypothetical protein